MKIVKCVTWLINKLRKLRRWCQDKGINVSVHGVDMADVLDVKHANFNGKITVSGYNENLNIVYHVKNGKLDLEYLKVKDI